MTQRKHFSRLNNKNEQLRILIIDSCKRLTERPTLLETAPALETIWYLGGAESTYPMESLQGFSHLPAVKKSLISS